MFESGSNTRYLRLHWNGISLDGYHGYCIIGHWTSSSFSTCPNLSTLLRIFSWSRETFPCFHLLLLCLRICFLSFHPWYISFISFGFYFYFHFLILTKLKCRRDRATAARMKVATNSFQTGVGDANVGRERVSSNGLVDTGNVSSEDDRQRRHLFINCFIRSLMKTRFLYFLFGGWGQHFYHHHDLIIIII